MAKNCCGMMMSIRPERCICRHFAVQCPPQAAEYDAAFMVCVTAPAFDAPWLGFSVSPRPMASQFSSTSLDRPVGRKNGSAFQGVAHASSIAAAIASGSAITETSVPMRAKCWSWAARTT
jgi:hypothetical protein